MSKTPMSMLNNDRYTCPFAAKPRCKTQHGEEYSDRLL